MVDLWNQLAARASVTLDAAQHDRLSRYLDLLLEANRTMNLTRIVDRASAEVQHVGDALTVLPFLPAGAFRLADVGSGGGVPGIPLAIARPDANVMLIESTQKKATFLKSAVESLGLGNVTVSSWRAEEVARSNSREAFHVAVARAVGSLAFLAEWCLPLVRIRGKMLAMKGAKIAEELPAAVRPIRLLGGGPAKVHPVELPGFAHLVVVEIPKIVGTPTKFPRPPTDAKGKPLT